LKLVSFTSFWSLLKALELAYLREREGEREGGREVGRLGGKEGGKEGERGMERECSAP
jgi:hypothetical protein